MSSSRSAAMSRILGRRRRLLERRHLLVAGPVQELDPAGDDPDARPPLALVLPGVAAEIPVDCHSAPSGQEVGTRLRLPVPGADLDEVGARVLPRPVDGEQEARHLLVGPELAELDVRREIADQGNTVHAVLLTLSTVTTLASRALPVCA